MISKSPHWLISSSLALLCFATGCGTRSGAVPYEGVVTLNGKPLAEATITLLPLTATGPGPFSGTTDSAGKFSLGPSGSPEEHGVAPDKYRLTISTLKVAPNENADDRAKPKILARELVPAEYRTGDMRVEVPVEGTTTANFDLVGQP